MCCCPFFFSLPLSFSRFLLLTLTLVFSQHCLLNRSIQIFNFYLLCFCFQILNLFFIFVYYFIPLHSPSLTSVSSIAAQVFLFHIQVSGNRETPMILFLRIWRAHTDMQEASRRGREIKQGCIMGKWPVGHVMSWSGFHESSFMTGRSVTPG